jgi:hypothetical protein
MGFGAGWPKDLANEELRMAAAMVGQETWTPGRKVEGEQREEDEGGGEVETGERTLRLR